MRVVALTTLSRATLPQARLLAETLRQAHPDWPIWAALAGDQGARFGRAELASFDAVATGAELGLADAPDGIVSDGAALGAALRHLLALGAELVVYFAPNIAVFHPLAGLPDAYRDESVVLTPHAAGAVDWFDPAFLAVRGDADGRAFAEWWAGRLGAQAEPAPCLPAHLNRVAIALEPGWNVAAWNLRERRLRFTPQGDITADGERLSFCRFDPAEPPEQPEAREVWDWHARWIAAPT